MKNLDFATHRQQYTIDNKAISYIDIGQGPVLLFGHSYLWDAQMWAPQIELLSQQYRCIVPDLWGHGLSTDMPAQCRNLRDVSAQMLSLMDSLDIGDFSVIGLSVGAMWGAELALLAPTRVKRLVMLNSFIGFEPEITRDKYYAMLDVIKHEKGISPALRATIIPLFFADNPNQLLVDKFELILANINSEQIDSLFRLGKMIFGRRDTLEQVEELTLPCLIMAGVQDKARSVLESYLMHDAIDGSKFIHIPDAGHISTLEQAEFVNQHLTEFLSATN
ncbi:2-succinyl-6-hydroxy-2,4-cyclohexadiene-1-carboxylate synthase [Shewanella sp. GutCb]|uniref:alpha/beta fold hydrolase n=1 Tax=Shewanella sp. GutCb TaxID=2058315 RepID=UPI000C7A0880|nr:alpha/beta fold hydrolase [Shewanella sp. GutCb]PKG73816.1 2-succinyl-6-hydroxy-2,4-cyclohexadiene-1-carboxylate synthase [Shewanella sp. GutCb]